MKPEIAAAELTAFVAETSEAEIRSSGPAHERWKAKAEAVMTAALGAESATLIRFRELRYSVGIWGGAPGERERDARFFASRVQEAAALLEAAIYEIDLTRAETGLGGVNYDVGLWQHIRHSVEEERWEQVASHSAIYVEDKVQTPTRVVWFHQPAQTPRDGMSGVCCKTAASVCGPHQSGVCYGCRRLRRWCSSAHCWRRAGRLPV